MIIKEEKKASDLSKKIKTCQYYDKIVSKYYKRS
jgi:hypothetical protein